MKALTISQPYASLIASGEKFIENRTWPTEFRGVFAIHAGKGSRYLTAGELRTYPTACIVATARLVMCIHRDELDRRNRSDVLVMRFTVGQLLDHIHCEGPYCWVLDSVKPLKEPIPYTGKLGLFDVPDSLFA